MKHTTFALLLALTLSSSALAESPVFCGYVEGNHETLPRNGASVPANLPMALAADASGTATFTWTADDASISFETMEDEGERWAMLVPDGELPMGTHTITTLLDGEMAGQTVFTVVEAAEFPAAGSLGELTAAAAQEVIRELPSGCSGANYSIAELELSLSEDVTPWADVLLVQLHRNDIDFQRYFVAPWELEDLYKPTYVAARTCTEVGEASQDVVIEANIPGRDEVLQASVTAQLPCTIVPEPAGCSTGGAPSTGLLGVLGIALVGLMRRRR